MNAKHDHDPTLIPAAPGEPHGNTPPPPELAGVDYTIDAAGISARNGTIKVGAGTVITFSNSTAGDVTVSVYDARGTTRDDSVLGVPFVVRAGVSSPLKVMQTTTSFGPRVLKATTGATTASVEVWHFVISATGKFNEIDDSDVPVFDPADSARSACHIRCDASVPQSVYAWSGANRVNLFGADPLVLGASDNPNLTITLRPTSDTIYVLTTTAVPPATPVKGYIKVKGSKGN
jgi:hypothetical protein